MFNQSKNFTGARIVLVFALLLVNLNVQPALAGTVSFGWANSMGGAEFDFGFDVFIDTAGNVFGTGKSEGAIFVNKYNNNGQNTWTKSLAGNGFGFSIFVDNNGDVLVTGPFQGTIDFDSGPGTHNLISSGANDAFILKLNDNGDFVWAKKIGGVSVDEGYGVEADGNGNVYVSGLFSGVVDFDPGFGTYELTSVGVNDAFILKLDSDGNLVWVKSMGGVSGAGAYSITLDGNGNILTTGGFSGTVDFDPGPGEYNLIGTGTSDGFISKLDGDGNFVWAQNIDGSAGVTTGIEIAVDGDNNVYATGFFSGTAQFGPAGSGINLVGAGGKEIFITKLNSNGDYLWAKGLGGDFGGEGWGIAVDGHGNVYSTGNFQGTADFDPGAGTSNLTSAAGSLDIFISKLDNQGNFRWAQRIGGDGSDYGEAIAVDDSGNVYLTGNFKDTVDFDPGTATYNLVSAGEDDVFISKLTFVPQTYYVTKIMDTDDGVCDSDCSLREAISHADSGDTVQFDPSLSGQTIVLGSTLGIDKTLTIDGSSLNANIKLDGDSLIESLLAVNTPDPIYPIVTIKNIDFINGLNYGIFHGRGELSIQNGSFIGNGTGIQSETNLNVTNSRFEGNITGIYNFGVLAVENSDFVTNTRGLVTEGVSNLSLPGNTTINSSTFTQNSQVAVKNQNGTLAVFDSSFVGNLSDYGGAIQTLGISSEIHRSLFENNSATQNGGAIQNGGNLTIFDSVFINNTAGNDGGAVASFGGLLISGSTFLSNTAGRFGGGLAANTEALVDNSTFYINSAASGGGVYLFQENFPLFRFTNNTISGNTGGGVYDDGNELELLNNIIANSVSGFDCFSSTTLMVTGNNNLIENNATLQNACGGVSISADPLLAPLADNGGFTQTMALLPGSPAIDAGDDTNCPATDQRGVARPQGSHCDIGAYEYEPPAVTPTFTTTVTSTFTPTYTPTSTPTPAPITIGETSILTSTYSGIGNQLVAQQVTLSQSATIQSLSYYVSTASGQLRLGIYNNNGTNPGTLVAETAAFTPVVGWNTQPVLTPTLLPAGTYWLAFLPQNNTFTGRIAFTGTGRYYSYTFGALPATFSTSPSSAAFHFSFYATLSLSAAPTSTPTRTPTSTPSIAPTATSTPTNTLTPTNSNTLTPSPTRTPTRTPTPTSTPLVTSTFTNTPINTATATVTHTPTVTSTNTPTRTATRTPTLTFTPTSSSSPAFTSTPAPITIGETSVLTSTYSGIGNQLIAQQVTLSQSATIQSLSYYVSTASGQLRLGIYNNNGSNPGTLVAETAAFTPVVGWNTQPVLTPTLLSAGTYWLAFLPQNNTLTGRITFSGTGRYYGYTFGALPSTFSTSPSSAAFHFSFYATLTLGSPATNTPTTVPSLTSTPTQTLTPTVTNTPTRTSTTTNTPLVTATLTNTPMQTPTRTPTRTPTATNTPTATSPGGTTITLGETTILSATYSGMANQLVAQQVTLSQSATIESLSYYVSTAGGQLRLGIYSNVANAPGSLLAQTAAFTPVTGWNTQPVLVETTLPAGTYWLAFLPQNNTLTGRITFSGAGQYYGYTFGAMPATFSSASTSGVFRFSLYATLRVP